MIAVRAKRGARYRVIALDSPEIMMFYNKNVQKKVRSSWNQRVSAGDVEIF